jgi:hypothetical protein
MVDDNTLNPCVDACHLTRLAPSTR